ncbi:MULTISPECIES: IS66 family insertion sequence element accessory protein TnpB [Sorangium]|uniref:Transposase n=1 Tax=Sorangium cellulosum (strain So ce56) TaxID=448385 RepID=A9G0V6_SORC5|nr:IS66 family insertion sequence element accessory protein TnpB [Sorangium cellulosum]CAN92441.1 transposase [Sorangium cellulosum So ce56]CAN95727.1 transposase [Sorangium cellulosum So ce56]CAN96270.1 transposase [Sorangium cellulosum So ce56]CAN96302.1 transposase [Sorangium cellulosum So ce56]CAN96448.1 transposase [Sorangium cellulosum So ce56]
MLTLPPSVRVYIAAEPTDLRKSFDGLSALVSQRFGADPLCGHLFVFRNRRGDQVRVLFWDRTGYMIVAKKLARGRFHLARDLPKGATHVEVEAAELSLMLEGFDLSEAVRRKRWRPSVRKIAPSKQSLMDARGIAISRAT